MFSKPEITRQPQHPINTKTTKISVSRLLWRKVTKPRFQMSPRICICNNHGSPLIRVSHLLSPKGEENDGGPTAVSVRAQERPAGCCCSSAGEERPPPRLRCLLAGSALLWRKGSHPDCLRKSGQPAPMDRQRKTASHRTPPPRSCCPGRGEPFCRRDVTGRLPPGQHKGLSKASPCRVVHNTIRNTELHIA